MRTSDCAPTLTDAQVIEFCANGFVMLEGIVPDDINRRTLDFVDAHPTNQPFEIMDEDWFVDGVILHPQAAGAVRSLLRKDFALPNLMSNHRVECPGPAQEWHTDGGSRYRPGLDYLQVFYYPQDCPRDMGPTELLPGSHFLYSGQRSKAHYGSIKGSHHAVAPAGSIFLTVYSIWHRRSASTGTGIRNNLKYNYWRTVPPQRDWIIEPDFKVEFAEFWGPEPSYREQFRDCRDASGLYAWLCGKYDDYELMGGQGWPLGRGHTWIGGPYGVPVALLED